MVIQPPAVVSKKCYKCEHVNPDQSFCGICGSPLVLDDFITAKVNDRLKDAIRDRDVLETDSAVKVFQKALDWMKLLFLGAAVALAIVGVAVGYQTWDFSKGAEKAKQSVADAAKKSSDDISAVSLQSKKEFAAAKIDITVASDNVANSTASFRKDLEASRHQLQAASDLHGQLEKLQTKLEQTNGAVEKQQKLLSSSQDFVKDVFKTHRSDIFFGLPNHQGMPTGRYGVLLPPGPQAPTVIFMLLNAAPIKETLLVQYQVFAQQPNTYFVVAHNLVVFYFGDPVEALQGKQISVSYFADTSDADLIKSLSEHDSRWFADDQPLPKYNQVDPDWKGNKWMPLVKP